MGEGRARPVRQRRLGLDRRRGGRSRTAGTISSRTGAATTAVRSWASRARADRAAVRRRFRRRDGLSVVRASVTATIRRPAARWPRGARRGRRRRGGADDAHVVGVDRAGGLEAVDVVGAELAVAHRPPSTATGAPSAAAGADHDPERLAAAGGARDLDEREVVAAGEDRGSGQPGTRSPQAAQPTPPASESRSSRGSIGPSLPGRPVARPGDGGRGGPDGLRWIPPGGIIGGRPVTTRRRPPCQQPRPAARRRRRPDHFRHSYSKDKAQPRPPPVADGGPGPRDRPDDRARGVLRRHPPADVARCAPRSTPLSILVLEDHVQGCVRTAAEQGEADALRRRGHRRRPADARPSGPREHAVELT